MALGSSQALPPTAAPPPAVATPPTANAPGTSWNTTQSQQGVNNTTGASNSLGNQASNATTANTYNQNQTANQNQLPTIYDSLMKGNIPNSFTAPQSVIDNYKTQFQSMQAPALALQGGAGTPMIAGQQAMGMSNLLSNLYQQGTGNYMNAIAGADANAYQATGGQQQNQGTQASNASSASNNSTADNTNSTYGAMQQLLGLLGGGGLGLSGGNP